MIDFRACYLYLIIVFVALFAVFPLTDTDIWWHLACARKWVTTWTPVREPVVNVHEYFQQVVAIVYDVGGAPLLVAFKAVLWSLVFALFLRFLCTPGCDFPQNFLPYLHHFVQKAVCQKAF